LKKAFKVEENYPEMKTYQNTFEELTKLASLNGNNSNLNNESKETTKRKML